LTYIWAIAGSVSAIASSTLIYAIFKSRQKLTTTHNRLLFGLGVYDIILSTSIAFSTLAIPGSTPNDIFTKGYGNQTTCNIQGFLLLVGSQMGPFYNAMLNLYFLCVVKFNLSDERIQQKIEPFMHVFPLLYSLSVASAAVFKEYINPRFYSCWLNTVPDHCFNNPAIECERGDEFINIFRFLFLSAPIVLSFLTIIASMAVIYHTVRKQERIMSTSYRQTGLIRARNNAGQHNEPILSLRRPVTNSRKVMHQAIGFTGAFLLA
jgi:hypothetical protein